MSLKPDPNVPNDGLSISKKPMSEAEKARRFGKLLKPLPPSLGKASKSEKAPGPTWPVRSTGDDFWHRDAESTARRWHAEKAVREYAKTQGWGEIRMRHLAELLEKEPEAVYSVTWRDLFAKAVRWATRVLPENIRGVQPVKVDADGTMRVAGPKREIDLNESTITLYTARPEKLPSAVRAFGKPRPEQAEALEALRGVAAFLNDPPLDGLPVEYVDEIAKIEGTRRGEGNLEKVRGEIAEKGHSTAEALEHARHRERRHRERKKRKR